MGLNRIFKRPAEAGAKIWRAPPRERIYAIGDIHGRLDLLDELLAIIAADDGARGSNAQSRVILLGDLVDRGPWSAQVVERVMELTAASDRFACLKGNHEEMLVRSWEGDRQVAAVFNRNGGRETAMSYGIDPDDYDTADLGELVELIGSHVPPEHIAFLDGLPDWIEAGDYLFAHAGIRPGVPLDEQSETDLRWIRKEFTEYRGDLGRMVIHGHTITEEIDERANRIGIDTGAYGSGRLTAIGLEDAERWFLQTGERVTFPG